METVTGTGHAMLPVYPMLKGDTVFLEFLFHEETLINRKLIELI